MEQIARQRDQRRVLLIVLALNAAMFVIELAAGIAAGSAALIADSADMFGDAFVYGVSLYALDRSDRWKNGAALAKAAFMMLMGVGVLIQAGVHLVQGAPPSSLLMTVFATLALATNVVCIVLLWRFRRQDINMASTFACSRNDVAANLGVLAAAGGVALTALPWPDVLVGSIIAVLFLRSAADIFRKAWPAFRAGTPENLDLSGPQA